jgi:hypothetical protein
MGGREIGVGADRIRLRNYEGNVAGIGDSGSAEFIFAGCHPKDYGTAVMLSAGWARDLLAVRQFTARMLAAERIWIEPASPERGIAELPWPDESAKADALQLAPFFQLRSRPLILLTRGLFNDRVIPPLNSTGLTVAMTEILDFAAQDGGAGTRRGVRQRSRGMRHSAPKQKLARRVLTVPNPRNQALLALEVERNWQDLLHLCQNRLCRSQRRLFRRPELYVAPMAIVRRNH